MAREIQKIRLVGNGAGILLPAELVARKGFKPGFRVRLEVTEQNISILPGREEREIKENVQYAKLAERSLRKNKETFKRFAR